MKHDKVLIFGFLFFIGIVVLFAHYLSLQPHPITQARPKLPQELLTNSYVQENILNASGDFDDSASEYVFNNQKYALPQEDLRREAAKPDPLWYVLGATTEPKHIVVDLKNQRVYAYEGERLVFNFLVSTGKWGATPTGHYKIWYKVRSQVMKGGNPAIGTYYYLPNVQYVQFFNKAIGFHSTYWHNNFGHPMSHGCVNMTTLDAQTLYYWASPEMPTGTKIFRASDDNPGTEVDVVDEWEV